MDLWIRSQDREQLALINELYIRCSCKEMPSQATYYIENKDLILGIYKTKERALEIIDEIQDVMLCKTEVKYSGKGFVNELGQAYIYEMPEE